MSEKSAIEWTDSTWNPVTGCTKVSPGCKHCYAETFAERWRGTPGHPYEKGFDLRLWPGRVGMPLMWKKPRMIFVNSMSDLFHEKVPLPFIQPGFPFWPSRSAPLYTKCPSAWAGCVRGPCFRLPTLSAGFTLQSN